MPTKQQLCLQLSPVSQSKYRQSNGLLSVLRAVMSIQATLAVLLCLPVQGLASQLRIQLLL